MVMNVNRPEGFGGGSGIGSAIKSGAKILGPAAVGAAIAAEADKSRTKALVDQYNKDRKVMGSQPDHHVTDNNNHTKPVTPAQKQAEAKRPMVGTDKSAAKKYGASSHNNGYTN
jgi:hypothetical protein